MKSALFQSLLVVLGVVLAFAANEWREAAAERHEAAVALASIREELTANRAAAAGAAAYHAEKRELIASRLATGGALTLADFPRGFVSPATLSTAAWTSAAETGALANLEYAKLVQLSRLYDMQGAYQKQTETAGAIIYQRMFDEGVESIPANAAGLVGLVSSFLFREQALVAAFDAALAAQDLKPED